MDAFSTSKHQKIIHISLITRETACIYLVKKRSFPKKTQERASRNSVCIWENISHKTEDSIVMIKINAEKGLCVCVYIYMYNSLKER